MDFDAIRQPGATEGAFQIVGVIDKKHRVDYVLLLEKLGEKFLTDRDRTL